jgi:dethiobiotin synthetase
MTIEALRSRAVPILGIAFVGDANEDSEATIAAMGNVRRLGRLPWLCELSRATLLEAFLGNFQKEDFIG